VKWVLSVLGAVLLNLLADEVVDWCPWLTERLLRRAARVLPEAHRDRYQEEWLAEVEALPGRFARLAMALRILLGAPGTAQALRCLPPLHNIAARRLLDVVVSAAALLLSTPLILLVALAVKLSGPGPVVFRQVRVGQGGKPFTMYKFRTMRPGTRGPGVALGDDPRITRVGKLLRTTGIDELPQFLNVLRGEMTLVGPRPEPPALAERYPADCRDVFQHRPGLTGPSQVGMRNKDVLPPDGVADIEGYYLRELVPSRVAQDFTYLNNPSLRRTIAMLWRTAVYVLRGSPETRSSRRPLKRLPPTDR
jgi:lipopolysaccharide/colanic/teichoic acid biosynthesis glycosyltransferase